jgi:hypothetical protein
MFSYKARLLVDGKEVEATLGKQVRQEDVEVLSVLDPSGTQVGRSAEVKLYTLLSFLYLPVTLMSLDTFLFLLLLLVNFGKTILIVL